MYRSCSYKRRSNKLHYGSSTNVSTTFNLLCSTAQQTRRRSGKKWLLTSLLLRISTRCMMGNSLCSCKIWSLCWIFGLWLSDFVFRCERMLSCVWEAFVYTSRISWIPPDATASDTLWALTSPEWFSSVTASVILIQQVELCNAVNSRDFTVETLWEVSLLTD